MSATVDALLHSYMGAGPGCDFRYRLCRGAGSSSLTLIPPVAVLPRRLRLRRRVMGCIGASKPEEAMCCRFTIAALRQAESDLP